MPVDYVRKEVTDLEPSWRLCRDVIAGSRAVKAAGSLYLPMLTDQSQGEYDAYKDRAKFYAATARTLQALLGLVFAKVPDIQAPKAIEGHLKDVNLDDKTLEDFSVDAFREVLGVGRLGILLDMQGDAVPLGERRPFWSVYRAEQIVNWRSSSVDGDTRLTLVVLKELVEEPVDEFESKCVEQYRVLELIERTYTVTKYRYNEEQKKWLPLPTVIPVRRAEPLDFIPFVIVNPNSLGAEPEKPPLHDMAEINIALYRRSADLEHGRHLTGLPQPWVTGLPGNTGTLKIGSAVAWVLELQGQAGYLEFKGEGLGALVAGVQEDKQEMAALGSEMFVDEHEGEETATAVRMRQGAKSASLKTMAGRLSSALTKLLRWHAWWFGAANDVNAESIEVKLNTEFLNTKLTPEEFNALLAAMQAGRLSFETFYHHLVRGEIARPGVTLEEERQAILKDQELDPPDPAFEGDEDVEDDDPDADATADAGGKKPVKKPAKKPPAKLEA